MRYGFERSNEVKGLKKKIMIRLLESDLTGLKELGLKLKAVQRATFKSRYRNLLGLLEVQAPAITALT